MSDTSVTQQQVDQKVIDVIQKITQASLTPHEELMAVADLQLALLIADGRPEHQLTLLAEYDREFTPGYRYAR